MYFTALLVVHCGLCLSLVFLVLLQQGKGADAGATFGGGGGGSNSVLGVSGADFITKITTALAITFMVTSILLVRAYQERGLLTGTRVSNPLEGSVIADVAEEVEAPKGAEVEVQKSLEKEPAAKDVLKKKEAVTTNKKTAVKSDNDAKKAKVNTQDKVSSMKPDNKEPVKEKK